MHGLHVRLRNDLSVHEMAKASSMNCCQGDRVVSEVKV